jgi:hemoglobin/transferrin/lactoferrin receptor protein
MKRLSATIILILITTISVIGQNTKLPVFVTVLDSADFTGIKSVYISNISNSNFVSTDGSGRADISVFNDTDSLRFRHAGYKSTTLAITQIKAKNFVVILSPADKKIEGITIFANKWEQKPREFPYTVREMQEKRIAELQPGTSADLLGNMNGVFLQKSQNGGGSPMIRGFAANGVLIVVNNVRMNNAIFRSGNLQNVINIHPAMIDKMEVIFGPGSVTYGSDALGGVMDFHLKKGIFSDSDKMNLKVNYTGTAITSPLTFNHNLDINFGFKKFAARTVLTYYQFESVYAGKKHYGDYPDFGKRTWVQGTSPAGNDTVYANPDYYKLIPSAYNSYGLLQNFSYKINDKMNLSYDFVISGTSDINRYDKLIILKKGNPKYAKWYYGPQKWMMNVLKFSYESPNIAFDEMEVEIANQLFEESRHDRKFGKTALRHRTENVNATTLNADFAKKITNDISVFYGAEINFNKVKSTANSEDINTHNISYATSRYPDGKNRYFTSGIYANGKYRYSEEITFLAGIRFSYASLNSNWLPSSVQSWPFNEVKLRNFAPNGSIGMAWLPLKKLQVNFNISSAFRAPNLDDVGKMFDSEPGKVTVPNDNLKPEYSYSAEASASYIPTKDITLGISTFYTFVDNIMVRRDYTINGLDSIVYDGEMSKVQAIVNAANGNIYGVNLYATISIIKDLRLKTDFTLMKGHDNDGNALRHVPPAFGSTGIMYFYKNMKFEFFSHYSGGIAFNDLAPEEQGKSHLYSPAGAEPWFTLNFRYGIKFRMGVEIYAGVNNILDRFYIPYSSGIAAPGRNLSFTIRTIF